MSIARWVLGAALVIGLSAECQPGPVRAGRARSVHADDVCEVVRHWSVTTGGPDRADKPGMLVDLNCQRAGEVRLVLTR